MTSGSDLCPCGSVSRPGLWWSRIICSSPAFERNGWNVMNFVYIVEFVNALHHSSRTLPDRFLKKMAYEQLLAPKSTRGWCALSQPHGVTSALQGNQVLDVKHLTHHATECGRLTSLSQHLPRCMSFLLSSFCCIFFLCIFHNPSLRDSTSFDWQSYVSVLSECFSRLIFYLLLLSFL